MFIVNTVEETVAIIVFSGACLFIDVVYTLSRYVSGVVGGVKEEMFVGIVVVSN